MSRFDRDVNSTLSGNGTLYSARSIAVGLSFFLAACSSPGVKVHAPDALGNNKSSHILEPQSLTLASVGEFTLDGDYSEEKQVPGILAQFGAFSPTLQQVDLAYCNYEGGLQTRYAPVRQSNNSADYYLFQTSAGYLAHIPQTVFESMELVSSDASDIWEDGCDNCLTETLAENIQHTCKDKDASERLVSGRDIIVVAIHSSIGEEGNNSILPRHQYPVFEGHRNSVAVERLTFEAKAHLRIRQEAEQAHTLEVYQQHHIADTNSICIGNNNNDSDALPPLYVALGKRSTSVSGKIHTLRDISPTRPVTDGQLHTARLGNSLVLTDYPDRPLVMDKRIGISLTNPAIFSGGPPSFYV